jgi:hypothetical protein
MANIWIKESFFGKKEVTSKDGDTDYVRYRLGETEWYESFTDDRGELFRSCREEYGGCTGKIHVDIAMGDGTYDTRDVGWVFEKRMKYEDCDETYLRQVWCEISPVPPRSMRNRRRAA